MQSGQLHRFLMDHRQVLVVCLPSHEHEHVLGLMPGLKASFEHRLLRDFAVAAFIKLK